MSNRALWTEAMVSNVTGAEYAARMYLEQTDVRHYLQLASLNHSLKKACEIGAGYARLTPILEEFADSVVAFERESDLLAKGSILHPSIEYRATESLSSLQAKNAEFQFGMFFTVLQHMSDAEAIAALEEAKRIVSQNGNILLCEDCDTDYDHENSSIPGAAFTLSRSIETYKTWMKPWNLVDVSPRRVEPTETRIEVGKYMLFAGSDVLRQV